MASRYEPGPKIDWKTTLLFESMDDWMKKEAISEFKRNPVLAPAHARNRKSDIFLNQLPGAWNMFRTYRNIADAEHPTSNKVKSTIMQACLKAATAAEVAFAWEGVAQGVTPKKSLEIARTEVAKYATTILKNQALLPRISLLDLPIDAAVSQYKGEDAYGKVLPTLVAVVGLGAMALLEQAEGNFALPAFPEPGFPLGIIYNSR